MTHSNRMIELVLARDEAVEAYQEKLSRIVVKHHEQLGALLNALPKVTGEVLAALVPDLATRTEKTIPEMIQAQAEELRGHLSVEQLEAFSELAEEAQKTRNELAAMIDAGMAQITAERLRVVDASEVAALLSDKLTGIAKSAAKQVTLAVPEVRALVTDMLAAQPKQLAATSGTALLDLFRGEFSSGTQAKRGEIWTFNGGTYICTAPTEFEPGRTNPAWALLAAPGQRGFPGVNGSAGGGGAGDVATDTIWDAAGDLVQGTGADAAARLAIGTAGQVLKVNSGATAAEWGVISTRQTAANSTGDTTLTAIASGAIQHTAVVTITGPAGTRNIALPVASRTAGDRAVIKCILPTTASIVIVIKNDTTGGTTLFTITTDTSGDDACFEVEYDGSAWQPLRYNYPLNTP